MVIPSAGCVPDRPLRLELREGVHRPPATVIIFLVDGLDQPRMDEMLAEGQLPNIRRHFVEGGVQVRDAVTSLPSITYANIPSVITGAYPAHHGVSGNFWFQRRTLEGRYYMTYWTYRDVNDHIRVPTLFELLDDHFTFNLQNHTRRGVSATVDNRLVFGLSWALGRYTHADEYVGYKFEEVAAVANEVGRWPSVVMSYYPGVDAVGHSDGADSARYAQALINIDNVVARVTSAMEAARPADAIYSVLVTDHGHVPIGPGKYFDMVRWLERERGMRMGRDPRPRGEYHHRFRTLDRYDALGGMAADRVFRLHLRSGRGWVFHPEPAEIEAWVTAHPSVVDVPAVLFTVARGGLDRVRVFARDGAATIERRRENGHTEYRLLDDNDLLGYRRSPELAAFIDAGWQPSREWLKATADTEYPDFVPQAVEMFDGPDMGELVMFAAEDWSFDLEQKGGHGSCLRRDMRIPLYFSGPDLPAGGAIGPGRLVDVMPTIVGLLNEEHHLNRLCILDGVNLAPELRQAQPLNREAEE